MRLIGLHWWNTRWPTRIQFLHVRLRDLMMPALPTSMVTPTSWMSTRFQLVRKRLRLTSGLLPLVPVQLVWKCLVTNSCTTMKTSWTCLRCQKKLPSSVLDSSQLNLLVSQQQPAQRFTLWLSTMWFCVSLIKIWRKIWLRKWRARVSRSTGTLIQLLLKKRLTVALTLLPLMDVVSQVTCHLSLPVAQVTLKIWILKLLALKLPETVLRWWLICAPLTQTFLRLVTLQNHQCQSWRQLVPMRPVM